MANEFEERLAYWRGELARQDAEWQKAMTSLATLGDEPLAVPDAFVEELDRVALPKRVLDPTLSNLRA